MSKGFGAVGRHGSGGAWPPRIAALTAVALLAACGGEQPVPVTQDGETGAEGQVLPGSIDDSMLPYAEIGGGGDPLSPAELDAEVGASTGSAADGPQASAPRPAAPRRPAGAATGGAGDTASDRASDRTGNASAPSPAATARDAGEEAEPEG